MNDSKKSIFFVDDEQGILDGLRRSLRGKRKEWDMQFFISGQDAIDQLGENHCDVMVSDMRMPGMDGAQLLTKVRTMSPETIRIALSGYSDAEMTLECVNATHQFIAKPAEGEKVVNAIERALATQSWLNQPKLKELLGHIDGLPTLPEIYSLLMRELSSEDSSMETVARIISRDVGLTSNILKIVNSAFFGLSRHVESPEQAATILGMSTLKNLALSTSIASQFEGDRQSDAQVARLNMEAQRLGLLVEKLSKKVGLTGFALDHAQIAAMLSGIGQLIGLRYRKGLEKAGCEDVDRNLLGAYLLSIWNLPFPVVEAVRWHTNPEASGMKDLCPAIILHLAWSIVQASNSGEPIDINNPFLQRDYVSRVIDLPLLNECIEIGNEFLEDKGTSSDGKSAVC